MILTRRRFQQTALALLPGTAYAQTPRRGGTLTLLILLIEPEPTSLVAFNTTGGPIVATSPKVAEGLLTYDFDLTPRPELASAWSISEDSLRYTLHLRPGVRWHDGRDFTSGDVAFAVGLMKEAHPRGRNTFSNVTKVLTPDPTDRRVGAVEPGAVTAVCTGRGRDTDRSAAHLRRHAGRRQSEQQRSDRDRAVSFQGVGAQQPYPV
ncbi:MAG: ABC transporter substrate-binding protein [Rhodopila sp.]|jgi:ABC-type transport system substrate-binding protein